MAQSISLKEDNVEEVLKELTLKEKASLVVGAGYKSMLMDPELKAFGKTVLLAPGESQTLGMEIK